MKKVLIFDECYTESLDLEKAINEYIDKYKINVVDIKINPVTEGYIVRDSYDSKNGEDIKGADRARKAIRFLPQNSSVPT